MGEARVTITDGYGCPVTIRANATEKERAKFLEALNTYAKEVLRYGNNWRVAKIAKEIDPTSVMAHVLHADYELASENYPAAMASLERARELASKPGACNEREQLYAQAWSEWLKGEGDPLATFAKIRKLYPTDLLALKRASVVAFLKHDFPRILELTRDPSGVLTGKPYYHGMLSFAYEQNGFCKEAELESKRALLVEPSDAWAQHGLAHVLLAQGRYSEGINWFGTQTKHWNTLMSFLYTHNWWHLGLFYMEAGDFKTTERIFDERLFPPATQPGAAPSSCGVPPGIVATAPPVYCELFPLNNRHNTEDQLGALGYLAKWEQRLRLLAAPSYTAPRPRIAETLTGRWADVVSALRVPTGHHAPLFDILVIHGLCRVGRFAHASLMVDSLSIAATSPTAPAEMSQVVLPVAKAVHALGEGRPLEAYKLFRPHVSHLFVMAREQERERVESRGQQGLQRDLPLPLNMEENPLLALGGSHEQREIADELFLDACLSVAECSDPAISKEDRLRALWDAVSVLRGKLPLRQKAPHWHALMARALSMLAREEEAAVMELRERAVSGAK